MGMNIASYLSAQQDASGGMAQFAMARNRSHEEQSTKPERNKSNANIQILQNKNICDV